VSGDAAEMHLAAEEAAALDESDLSDATQARQEDVAFAGAGTIDWGPTTQEPPAHVSADDGTYDGPGWDKATRSIVSLDGLNWAGGVLREIRAAMAQNEEMAKGEIEALEHKLNVARLRLDRAQKPLASDAEFFERAIATYAQAHKAEILKGYGKRKSRRFPSGLTVAYRAVSGGFRWRKDVTADDETALLKWATDRTGSVTPLTKMERVIDLEAIKSFALADQSGKAEAPPGLEWVPEGETITVKVGEEK
jgi:hypothetical protein